MNDLKLNLNYHITFFFLFFFGWILDIYSILDIGNNSLTILYLSIIFPVIFIFKNIRNIKLNLFIVSYSFLLVISLCTNIFYLGYFSEKILTHLLQYVFTILILIYIFNNKKKIIMFLNNYLFLLISIVVLYAIYQQFARIYDLPLSFLKVSNLQLNTENSMGFQRGYNQWLDNRVFSSRVSSFFVEPGHLAYFCISVKILSDSFIKKINIKKRINILSYIGVILSQSFGGFIILLLLIIKRKNIFIISIILILINIILFQFFNDYVSSDFSVIFRAFDLYVNGIENLNNQARFSTFYDNIQNWLINPIFGNGLASISILFPKNFYTNFYQIMLTEKGIFGFIIFFLTLIINSKNKLITKFILLSMLWKPYIYFIPSFFMIACSFFERTKNN